MSSLLSLLNSSNYRTYSLVVAKKLKSVLAAIYLGELIQRYEFHQENKDLITLRNQDGKWFYFTESKCEERTGLSHDNQETAIKTLVKLGLIKKIVAGLPSKRHFQLNELAIFQFLMDSKNLSSLEESSEVESSIPPNYDGAILPSTKETNKEPLSKKTTTNKRNSSSSIIDRNLEKLNELGLDKEQKHTLYQQFDDETILQAIAYYRTQKKQPGNLGGFIYSACLKGYKKSSSKEDVVQSNKKFAKKHIQKYDDMKERNGYRVAVLSKHIEFVSGQRVNYIDYEDADFQNKVKSLIIKIDPNVKF